MNVRAVHLTVNQVNSLLHNEMYTIQLRGISVLTI